MDTEAAAHSEDAGPHTGSTIAIEICSPDPIVGDLEVQSWSVHAGGDGGVVCVGVFDDVGHGFADDVVGSGLDGEGQPGLVDVYADVCRESFGDDLYGSS